jgi:hypothetical protein
VVVVGLVGWEGRAAPVGAAAYEVSGARVMSSVMQCSGRTGGKCIVNRCLWENNWLDSKSTGKKPV